MEDVVFCYLITAVTSYYFCPILFVRSKILGLFLHKGKEFPQGHEYKDLGLTKDHLRDCLTQTPRTII